MKRNRVLLLLICLHFLYAKAMPAFPYKLRFIEGNDTIWLTLQGDEHNKYAIDNDGYTVIHDSIGWFYATKSADGEVLKSDFRIKSTQRMDEQTKSFLENTPKGLCPSFNSVNENRNKLRKKQSKPVVGERRVLIILMQYNDLSFIKDQDDFDRLFNEKDYREDGAYGSVYDYYNQVSYCQLHLQSDVIGPYTASHNMSYYGANNGTSGGDKNPKLLFDEAMRFAIKDVNLSDYDSDEDGYVDNVHIIFAGYGEEAGAASNAIWSHEMTFLPMEIGGMMIDHYSCSPELRGNSGHGISRIGPPCHEIGHALGAMDYYDVDYQKGGYYEGTGGWDIMASGSWNDEGARPADFNPYVKIYNFGWSEIQTFIKDTVNIIEASSLKNNIYRIDTPVGGDYFLLENRQSYGVTSAEPGKGLLIFHIGPAIEQKSKTNTINSSYPQYCYVVCASSHYAWPHGVASSYGNISSSGCPYPGSSNNTEFSKNSVPGAFTINGSDAGISLTNIKLLQDGSIQLFYGIAEPNDDNPDNPPIDDNEDINGEIFWSDDFEIANYYLSQTWIQENIIGSGVWVTKQFSSSYDGKEPTVGSGLRYLEMVYSNESTLSGNTLRYCSRIVSNSIDLLEGDYILCGKYSGYATTKMPLDTIYIEMFSDAVGNWRTIQSIRVMNLINKNIWNTFNIPITLSKEDKVRISFKGSADSKSLLFLDKLILYRPVETNIEPLPYNEKRIYNIDGIPVDGAEIYHIDGSKVNSSDIITQNSNHGIYIVRLTNGKNRKIIR